MGFTYKRVVGINGGQIVVEFNVVIFARGEGGEAGAPGVDTSAVVTESCRLSLIRLGALYASNTI